MAYGIKYFARYTSGSEIRTINLMLDGYTGPATEWFCSNDLPATDQGDSDSIFGELVVSEIFRMQFMFDQHYDLSEFVAEPRTYKVELFNGSGNIIFAGYVEPYDTFRDHRAPNYFVTMNATCGLNRLAKNQFQQTEFNEGNLELSYFEILQRCLATIGIERNLRVSLHTYQNAYPSAPNPLLSCEVSVFRYYKDGVWLDCQTILIDILEKFNAQLFLEENIWVVRSSIDHSLGFTAYLEYLVGGGQVAVPSWPDLIKDVNYVEGDPLGSAATTAGGQITLQPRIRKYTTEVDFGGTDEQFTNAGLQLWDVNGPVGWEGNMIQAVGGGPGWTRVDTGLAGSPYALNIRGIAPPPYSKKRKKGIWPFRKTITTAIEPEIYWETPEIEILKTDETINIGFEYFTEANSAGFFYTITLFTTNPVDGAINRVYLKDDGSNFPFADEYTMLKAPPHPKVNPDTGIAQAKGSIEYNIDVKQLNSSKVFFDRIEIWFYFSVKEDGKTGDEYTLYSIIGDKVAAAETKVPEGDSRYKTVLESNPYESDEGETINLITGDYSDGFLGTTHVNLGDLTKRWTRRGQNEAISIYRAMMADRLSVTYNVSDVVRGNIKVLDGSEIRYIHLLRFLDRHPTRLYKIVRLNYDHYRQIANVVAVEISYTALSTIKQTSYTDARGLLDEEANSDGVYPGAGTPSGRVGAEDEELFDEEDEEDVRNARTGLFEDLPTLTYIYGEKSTETLDLSRYFSEMYLSEQDEDIDEEDRHDPYDFRFETKSKPSWISELSIVYLNLAATGTPTQIGSTSLVFAVIDDTFGLIQDITVPIIVYPKTKFAYELIDTHPAEELPVGTLPGVYPVPGMSEIEISISGPHEFYQFTLEGGGPTGESVKKTVNRFMAQTSSGKYRFFQETNGQILPEGLYRLYVYTSLNERRVAQDNITFILGDEEYLNKVKFYLTESSTDIGEISPSGTSKFMDPGQWDNRVQVTDVEHDKAVVYLTEFDGTPIKEREITLGSPTTSGSYFVYEEDQQRELGKYNVSVKLFLDDIEVFMRYADFETIRNAPEAEGGKLQLLAKSQDSITFTKIADLPKTGGSYERPDGGWNIGSDAETDLFDWEGDELLQLQGESLVRIDVPKLTGRPAFIEYPFPVTFSEYKLFDNRSSINFGSLHDTPNTFRYIRTRKIGGASGDVVAVLSSDFSFGPFVPIDDTPIVDPSTDFLIPRRALMLVTEGQANYIDVRTDETTITVDEDNNLTLVEAGVTYNYIQNMPARSVLGRKESFTGVPGAWIVKDLLADVVAGDLISIDVVNEILNGTTGGYLALTNVSKGNVVPIFTGDVNAYTFPGMALLSSSATNIPNATPGYLITGANGVNIGQLVIGRSGDNSYYRGSTTGGGGLGAWNQIASRSWVTTFYVPLVRTISTTTGLTGGASLTSNLTLGLDFTYLDGRYATGTAQNVDWTLVHSPNIGKYNSSATNSPAPGTNYHGIYMPHVVAGYGSTIAMRNGAMWFRSVEANVWGTWLQTADRAWVTATFVPLTRTISTGSGLLGGASLNANISLTLDYTLLDARWSTTGISNLDWSTVHTDGKWKFNANSGNSPIGGTTTHGIFIPHPTAGFGSAIAMRNGAMYYRGLEGSVWGSWFQVADRAWVDAKTVTAGNGMTGGGTIGSVPVITLGTPSTLTNATTNAVTSTSHTHAIQTANLIAGSNVTFSSPGNNVILGSTNITVSVTSFPWPNLTSKPTTLDELGVIDIYDKLEIDGFLTLKEDIFSKGSLIQGTGIVLSGTLTNRLVNSGNVTVSLATTGVSAGTYNSFTVDIYGRITAASNVSSGVSGTTGYFPKFTSSTTIGNSPMRDTGSEINVDNTRSFGVEGPAAMRDYLHVWGYQSNGTASNHGSIVVHNETSATAHASAAIEIRSTTRGLLLPRMTHAQRLAITGTVGLVVYQTDASGSSPAGAYLHMGIFGGWVHLTWDYVDP